MSTFQVIILKLYLNEINMTVIHVLERNNMIKQKNKNAQLLMLLSAIQKLNSISQMFS